MTVRKMATPGAAAYHHASGRNSRASAIVPSHSGWAAGARAEEAERGSGQDREPHADRRPHDDGRGEFGSTCSTVSRHGEAPRAVVLSTKTSFCSARVSA